ncbi:MAG: glycosyltransferase [Erysipelotrichaceae bacterium]|nr:glycosyltransferase [Clostridia bacterium]MBQ6217753.1 glycosyltransferase [Erysipelotrichaceae bacterium]
MSADSKKVSVLMGTYNCVSTIKEAIRSIQKQTYTNWELIICDDGSTDETLKIIEEESLSDPRLLILKNDRNQGLNKTLNKCIKVASGEYAARMDGDDLCRPDRFEKQITYLENHPEIQIVSSWMSLFDENGVWGVQKIPEYPTKEQVVTGTAIHHAPVMMRMDCLREVDGYTEDIHKLRVEDVDLWIKLYAKGIRCYNIQEPLYEMRNDQNALNRRKFIYRINSTRTRLEGCRKLGLGAKCYLLSFRPVINGMVPAKIRNKIKRPKRSH